MRTYDEIKKSVEVELNRTISNLEDLKQEQLKKGNDIVAPFNSKIEDAKLALANLDEATKQDIARNVNSLLTGIKETLDFNVDKTNFENFYNTSKDNHERFNGAMQRLGITPEELGNLLPNPVQIREDTTYDQITEYFNNTYGTEIPKRAELKQAEHSGDIKLKEEIRRKNGNFGEYGILEVKYDIPEIQNVDKTVTMQGIVGDDLNVPPEVKEKIENQIASQDREERNKYYTEQDRLQGFADQVINYYMEKGNVSEMPAELQEAYNVLGPETFDEVKHRSVQIHDIRAEEAQMLVDQMAQGVDVLGENTDEMTQSNGKTMGFAKLGVLGVVTALISLGIIILGIILIK